MRLTPNPRHAPVIRACIGLQPTDYIILLSGQITLVLDKQEVDARPSTSHSERGTNHAWVNKVNEDALLMAVLVDAGQPK